MLKKLSRIVSIILILAVIMFTGQVLVQPAEVKAATIQDQLDYMRSLDIIVYAWGGIETGENTTEFYSMIDTAYSNGYDAVLMSVAPKYLAGGKLDSAELQRVDDAITYVTNKGMKIMLRWAHRFDASLGIVDYWSDGTTTDEYPDFWNATHWNTMLHYDQKMAQHYAGNASILSLSPIFGFLSQSLFDAGNFDADPYERSTGYSTLARDAFNSAYSYSGNLPVPTTDGVPQNMKTINWFKFRQQKLTEYAEAAVSRVKQYTTKPVGVFAELYPATFVHQSEASPSNLDFWLQDCTFGCQTYNMPNTFAETHGNQENYSTFEAWRDAIMPRLKEAVEKGNKLMGFWWRDKPTYSMQILPYIKKLEKTYAYNSTVSSKVGIVFNANYSASALSGTVWNNIRNATDTKFVFTGDFARAAYLPGIGYNDVTPWESNKWFDYANIKYVAGTSSNIQIIDSNSILTQNLNTSFTYGADRWADFIDTTQCSDVSIKAKMGGKLFIFTRHNGQQIFIPNRVFGYAQDYGGEYLTLGNQLVDNIIKYSGLAPVKAFDFGTAASTVTPGYNQVTTSTLYSTSQGYGYVDGSSISAIDRGAPDDMLRDFHTSSADKDFKVDLANGTYIVSVTMGDNYPGTAQGPTTVYAENVVKIDGCGPDMVGDGNFVTKKFVVTVSDGQLNLKFHGGTSSATTGNGWFVNAITITQG